MEIFSGLAEPVAATDYWPKLNCASLQPQITVEYPRNECFGAQFKAVAIPSKKYYGMEVIAWSIHLDDPENWEHFSYNNYSVLCISFPTISHIISVWLKCIPSFHSILKGWLSKNYRIANCRWLAVTDLRQSSWIIELGKSFLCHKWWWV